MSEILNLAREFESKSKQQAKTTATSVALAFGKHEKHITEALRLSSKNIQTAIQEENDNQLKQIHRLVGMTWLYSLALSGILFAILIGVAWYLGTIVIERQNEISEQSQILQDLKSQTGAGVSIIRDSKNKSVYYLILPQGAKQIDEYKNAQHRQVIKYSAK
ncbi:MbeB family mobilization protein [Plesiomonas shigelloides]|uniref:MbeB family mobilization protein n=1 Tax=Plesiomonas shigelloides TaxID=703 RepID=UPI002247F11C|nr:MbeB family mobilization protein [Plesiomonas shigelloides]MCX2499486.1 MbeB family mobilization protein [Plesiomonas shigelloides]